MDKLQVGGLIANSSKYLDALDKYESEKSLINFMKLAWSQLEPGIEFVPNWGVSAICDHLEAVTSGEIRRLLINVPPGCTKSMTTNVFWPAWEWGPKGLPHYRYINVSHEKSLAMRDNVRCRSLINSEFYQKHWGDLFSFKRDQNEKSNYENDKTGFRQSTPAISITGKRGDRVIYDDPHSVSKAESDTLRENVLRSFSEEVPTRLNKPSQSAIIVIMQRVAEMDVSGLILENDMGYEHLMLPMEFESSRKCYSIVKPSYVKNSKREKVFWDKSSKSWKSVKEIKEDDDIMDLKTEMRYCSDIRSNEGDLLDPIRYPRSSIDELKSAMRAWSGTYAEAGQLQQRPAPRGGGSFKKSDFIIIDSLKDLNITHVSKRVRGWDLAASTSKKSPYTVGVYMVEADGKIIIMDVNRFRQSPAKMEAELKRTARADGIRVVQHLPQDPGQAGKVQKASYAKLLAGSRFKFNIESGSKQTRAAPFASQVEAGNVFLIRADWNSAFLNEAKLFPNGEFKDQIDACSMSYAGLLQKKVKSISTQSELIQA